jgi:hypothetical protein
VKKILPGEIREYFSVSISCLTEKNHPFSLIWYIFIILFYLIFYGENYLISKGINGREQIQEKLGKFMFSFILILWKKSGENCLHFEILITFSGRFEFVQFLIIFEIKRFVCFWRWVSHLKILSERFNKRLFIRLSGFKSLKSIGISNHSAFIFFNYYFLFKGLSIPLQHITKKLKMNCNFVF